MAHSSDLAHDKNYDDRMLFQRYLSAVRKRSVSLPLFGLYDQANLEDQVSVDLAGLYTPLMVREETLRETFTTPSDFSLASILETNEDPRSPPEKHRSRVRIYHDEVYQTAVGVLPPEMAERYRSTRSPIDFHLADKDDPTARAHLRAFSRTALRIEVYSPELVTEALARSNRMVLLGEPGSGKSTALRYVAYGLAEQALSAGTEKPVILPGWEGVSNVIPVYAPLLPFAWSLNEHSETGSADHLWSYLSTRIKTDIEEFVEDQKLRQDILSLVLREIQAGRAVILLDGLDEVAGTTSRRLIVQAVASFAQELPSCRIIVACRIRAYLGSQNAELRLNEWPTATLNDWTQAQTRAFVHAWYDNVRHDKLVSQPMRKKRAEQLLSAIRVRDDLAKLGHRPLLLTIMSLVHLYDGRLPEDRVRLYGRCINILIDRWEVIGRPHLSEYGRMMEYIGIADRDAQSLRSLLEDIAFSAHGRSSGDRLARISRKDLEDLVSSALSELGHEDVPSGTKRFIEYTDVRAGLLHASDAGDAYVFAHTTFQEYLAGLALIRDVEFVKLIMDRRQDDRWRVPIQLGIGHCVSENTLAMPYQLLDALIRDDQRPKTVWHRDIIFAAELAEDVAWDRLEKGGNRFKILRAQLGRVLAQVLEEPALPMHERLRAGFLLANVGDNRPGVCNLPPAMVPLDGGTFSIGVPPAVAYPRNLHNRSLSHIQPFECGKYPITNAQYQTFIASDGYNPARSWWDAAGRAWLTRDDASTPNLDPLRHRILRKDVTHKEYPLRWEHPHYGINNPNRPVVGICWYEAIAFCRWLTLYMDDGYVYMLPSELEWEYAARGLQGRLYPWGPSQQFGDIAERSDRPNRTVPVGSYAQYATPEKIMDMLRNVWEWTRSIYRDYPYDPDDGREDHGMSGDLQVVVRGASLPDLWRAPKAIDRTAAWKDSLPSAEMGFRVIRRRLSDTD